MNETPTDELRKFYWPAYLLVGLVNPILLLLVAPVTPLSWAIAFFLSYSIVWPITYVTYPVFFKYLTRKYGLGYSECFLNPSCLIQNPLFLVKSLLVVMAFIFPIIVFWVQIRRHKRYVERKTQKQYSYKELLDRYIG